MAEVRLARWRLRKTVVMVGMMGAGKTAIGGHLAKVLGVPFRDSDEEIVKAANNMSIAEIFERDGEAFFRQRESEVLHRLMQGPPCVLSTGGGAFVAEANRTVISDRGVSVWLRADLTLLWHRVKRKTTRPLLKTPDPYGTLAALYETRLPIYQLADIAVDCAESLTIEQMTDRVIEALQARHDVLERT
jgi:shikimate kinase